MAVNNISQNRLQGEIVEDGQPKNITIASIVEGVTNDITHLRSKMENLPPFPEGKYPIAWQWFRAKTNDSAGEVPEQGDVDRGAPEQ